MSEKYKKFVPVSFNETKDLTYSSGKLFENLLKTIPHTVIDHNTDVDVLIDQICDDIVKHKKENS